MAGVEWYDSGIGFAIPLEHIEKVLPRLKKGEDLYPGLAGVSLKGPNLYTGEPMIAACRAEVAGRRGRAARPATESWRSTAARSPARPR